MTIDKTDAAIGAVINKLSALADVHGAEAVALGAKVMQLQAAGSMLWPVGVLAVGAGGLLAAKRLWSRYRTLERTDTYGDHDGWIALAMVASVAAVGGLFVGTLGIFIDTASPLNWATLFDGRIGLAAKILNKL